MGERFLVTGCQLGLLKVGTPEEREVLVEEIIEDQFVGRSACKIKDDVKAVEKAKVIKEL